MYVREANLSLSLSLFLLGFPFSWQLIFCCGRQWRRRRRWQRSSPGIQSNLFSQTPSQKPSQPLSVTSGEAIERKHSSNNNSSSSSNTRRQQTSSTAKPDPMCFIAQQQQESKKAKNKKNEKEGQEAKLIKGLKTVKRESK